MVGFERAQRVADHLWAKAELREARPAGFLVLLVLTLLSARYPTHTSGVWVGGMGTAMVLGPWLLRMILPSGSLLAYRLSALILALNTLMLGFVAFMETVKLPALEVEELPQMRWFFQALSLLIPLGYLLVQAPAAVRRMRLAFRVSEALPDPVDSEAMDEVTRALGQALGRSSNAEDSWAEFETVPASPRNLKAFLRPDFEKHGLWRVAMGKTWAVVVHRDGSRAEAVRVGGLKLVSDDPKPGTRKVLCLVRWNSNLREGRIAWDQRLKLQAWNAGDRGATVPSPY